jgi:hypothetical protein
MLWHARRIGLTDDDLDYMSDSQLGDLLELDGWFNSPTDSTKSKSHQVVHHMTPAEVDAQFSRV